MIASIALNSYRPLSFLRHFLHLFIFNVFIDPDDPLTFFLLQLFHIYDVHHKNAYLFYKTEIVKQKTLKLHKKKNPIINRTRSS